MRPTFTINVPWTPERIERLRELAAQGLTSARIAAILSTTRNVVIGKCHRRGIPLISQLPRQPANPKRSVPLHNEPSKPNPPHPARATKLAWAKARAKPAAKPNPPPAPVVAPVAARPVTLAERTINMCAYPIGDPGDLSTFRYCGAVRRDYRTPYCAEHFQATHYPAKESPVKRPWTASAITGTFS